MTGWTCPSCGVNYAPSVTQCRCSVVTDDWIEQMRKIAETPPVYGPVVPWVDPMDYWRKPPWQRNGWYCGDAVKSTLTVDTGGKPECPVVATTWIVRPDGTHRRVNVEYPSADLSNVDYLQLASLGGRQ